MIKFWKLENIEIYDYFDQKKIQYRYRMAIIEFAFFRPKIDVHIYEWDHEWEIFHV